MSFKKQSFPCKDCKQSDMCQIVCCGKRFVFELYKALFLLLGFFIMLRVLVELL